MKLKGELELNAERLYSYVEEEMYNIAKASKDNIDKVDTSDISGFIPTISDIAFELNMYYTISSVIYMADFNLSEVNLMLDMCKTNKLLEIIYKFIKANENNINVNNKSEIEKYIKISLSMMSIYNEEVAKFENK